MRRLGNRNLSLAAGVITLGYFLLMLTASLLEARWGVFPVLAAFFVLCFGQGLLYTPLMHTTLEKVALEEVGAASDVYTTTMQTSNTLGIAIMGMMYAMLTSSVESPLHAFALTLLLLTLLSLGIFVLVQLLEPRRTKIGQRAP